ncbi:MAG: A/G-specific adenine glycosylase [bacterium]
MKLEEKFRLKFSEKLIAWYHEHKRDLPWRHTDDPYKIWVSEVMLQQTQVETVIPYYHKFVRIFPDVRTLAQASLSKVLKAWEGMGYYARARNLHSAAQAILKDRKGVLPTSHDELLKVSGIGPYTAAAVASIAFNEDYPVVDGNVLRVLARVMKIMEPPGKKGAKSRFVNAARQLLPPGKSSVFNQAMMELGALVCLPRRPKCSTCPISFFCQAYGSMADPAILPAKEAPKDRPHYDIAVGIIWHKGKILIHQRPTNGLLGGLWEFPGGKQERSETLEECLAREVRDDLGIEIRVQGPFLTVPHAYTHFRITLHSFQCQHLSGQPVPRKGVACKWVTPQEAKRFAFSTSNRKVLEMLLESMQ